MHGIKEFILHHHGYDQWACSPLWISQDRQCYVILSARLCVAARGSACCLHCTDAGYWLCIKNKKKKTFKNNKAMLSHLIHPALIGSSFHLRNAWLFTSWCLVPEKPWACVQHWSSPQSKLTHTNPIVGLTCILIIFVSPPGREINTSHQPSAGKHSVEAVNKLHAARDFWQKL